MLVRSTEMPEIQSNGRPVYDARTVFAHKPIEIKKPRPYVPGVIAANGGYTRPSDNTSR